MRSWVMARTARQDDYRHVRPILFAMLEQEPEAERIARALAATPDRAVGGKSP